ncbi:MULTISPECIES: hypothetical protein [unclassified Chelatococcus]|uniref:hypothetical protein n=1 Tax=unclassified Chelatococcus TaxID=2638111 RepID=UPI000316740E|nr:MULTISPECIES: hypothetical protein [unclassified Chelatococcus]ALA18822.1 hypothetical protein AL346_17190 [Chelatococcus sp. CO-6]
MVAVILVVAGVLVAGGFYAVMAGAEVIVLERGWSMVIAGSVFAAAGFVLAAIALLMRDLRRLAAGLEFLPARESSPGRAAEQPFDDEADFRPVVVPGVPIAPSAAAGAAAPTLGGKAWAEEETREAEAAEEPGFETMRPFPSRRFEDRPAVEEEPEEREEPVSAAAPDQPAPAEEEPAQPSRTGKLDDPFARFDFSRDFFATERQTARAESQEAGEEQTEEPRLSTFGTAPQVSEEPEAAAEPEPEPAPKREETLPQLPSWLRRSEDRGEAKGFEAPAATWPQQEREAPPAPAADEETPEEAEVGLEADRAEEVPAERGELEEHEGAEEAAPAGEEADAATAAPTVVGTYSAGGNLYVMYSDGSIEAETGRGVFKFASLDELKNYIATGEGGQLQSSGQPAPKND